MDRIIFETSGSTSKTDRFLSDVLRGGKIESLLNSYGAQGVRALVAATPRRTGATADSWSYEVVKENGRYILNFLNSNRQDGGPPVAILIQLGHGTATGGYVTGVDYINPALKPIFDQISNQAWKAVSSA